MMILARPSVSPYLTRALMEMRVPVVVADDAPVPMRPALDVISPSDLRSAPRRAYQSLVLTSSENALSYLYDVIPHDDRVLKARIFKDKGAFRRATRDLVPGFYFEVHTLDELAKLDPKTIPFPVVVKPAVGISSIGVVRVASADEWLAAVAFLANDLEEYKANYRSAVVEGERMLVESWIEGQELAIDGFFDAQANPVILNILEHLFAHPGDTSDRIYYTRKSLVARFYEPIMEFLQRFGDAFDLKRFPFHLEVRFTPDGRIVPIELNPLRFSGLGTTEIAEYAYGVNVYEHFFRQTSPDWPTLLKRSDDSVYSFACVDIPTDLFRNPQLVIRDRELLRELSEVLDYRMLSETETSTFAVIFFRSPELDEAKRFLTLDLNPFFQV
jgi:hypothetical protein